jgi:hypothetical protein
MDTAHHRSTALRVRTALVALLVIVASAASYGTAAAHDQGILKLASKMFRAGDSLAITGAKFTKKDEVTLVLIGIAGRLTLAEVPTDSTGAFRKTVLVPASVAAGQYRLVAEAIDGDEVAALEVMVHAASSAAPMAAMPGMEGAPGHEGMDPTGEALTIARARGTAVTATAILLITACVGAGAILLRRPQAIPLEEQS